MKYDIDLVYFFRILSFEFTLITLIAPMSAIKPHPFVELMMFAWLVSNIDSWFSIAIS